MTFRIAPHSSKAPPVPPSRDRRTSGRANRVRIIGGEWRSRLIEFPDGEGLRPTPDRVRETLFNWLGQDLTGRRVLDLFAGSGVLGFEALSRGASSAVMIDRSRDAVRLMKANAANLGAVRAELLQCDAIEFLNRPRGLPFDVVFVDPPYSSGLAETALTRLAPHLAPEGVVYAESAAPLTPDGWAVLKSGRAGAVCYQLLGRKSDD
jgi:16S rRNA (guanine966-N2)-methyltransferase